MFKSGAKKLRPSSHQKNYQNKAVVRKRRQYDEHRKQESPLDCSQVSLIMQQSAFPADLLFFPKLLSAFSDVHSTWVRINKYETNYSRTLEVIEFVSCSTKCTLQEISKKEHSELLVKLNNTSALSGKKTEICIVRNFVAKRTVIKAFVTISERHSFATSKLKHL